ncbi:MAG TPA: glucose PTS transporter subunit IIA [Candidatus Lachnoclostridium pullistercoris]|uniref:Glucose PTS transporter subunit IIA n=1 Tax=Candidatus Lachnoclostridium pullistercoris TaxID=2838632 RepID=A0A9D2PGM4_9FIRM|nr:glucose PTS transporter subunit IIA [Candidatus Lachnoclostridium pullistercoris]
MNKKNKIMDFFSALGRSLLMPIAALAACGIVLGLTSALMKAQVQEAVPFLAQTYVYFIISTLNKVSNVVFTLIPVLFSISIAFGLAKEEKEIAAFAGFIGYYTFLVASSCLIGAGFMDFSALKISNILGVETLDMGAVAGIIIGLVTAKVHNKYHKITFPVAISFYGGKRFVAIAVIMISAVIGLIAPIVWSPISMAINGLGGAISAAGLAGVFGYGFLERLLIPTGLHHVLNGLFRTTAIGGVYEGVEGCLNIFLQFIDKVDISELAPYTVFLGQGKMPMMMFGLPGAALAIYRTAPAEKKQKVKALMIAGVAASVVSGITEPLEFAFMFVAPQLFVFHAVMGGISFMSMAALHVIIGNTGGGLIDYLIWGVFQPGSHWYWVIVVGIPFAVIYYNVFKWYLTKKNISIEVADEDEETAPASGAVMGEQQMAQAYRIIEGLGGSANIKEANNCLTRLRVDIADASLVREDVLKKTGAMGFIRPSETHIQVVYGPKVEAIAANVRECLRSGKVIPAAAQSKHQLFAPVSGSVVPMKEAPDETFSSCMMGDGVVIHPTDDVVKAPCSGTVAVYTEENKHAIGLQTEDGLELLIHIGVDTVNLKGEGFEGLVSAGDKIRAGEPLIRFAKAELEKKGYCTDVMVIVMANGDFDVKYTTGMTAQAGKTVVAEY